MTNRLKELKRQQTKSKKKKKKKIRRKYSVLHFALEETKTHNVSTNVAKFELRGN